MRKSVAIQINCLVIAILSIFSSYAFSGQWKPLCIEGSSCNAPYQVKLGGGWSGGDYRPVDPSAAGPLATKDGILLHHTPYELPVLGDSSVPDRHVMLLTGTGIVDVGEGFGYVSDVTAIELPSGKSMSFYLGGGVEWFTLNGEKTDFSWYTKNWLNLNLAVVTGPPVVVGNTIFTGIRWGGGQSIFYSEDDGYSWVEKRLDFRIGDDRYNLLASPEAAALWVIRSEFDTMPAGLFETSNLGENWQQVDDGSFPVSAVRVVHDPSNPLTSYALAGDGLYVSYNRGVSWQVTTLSEPVHGLVFAMRTIPLTRALIVGTDTGVKVSVDEAQSWLDMSEGLLEIPHTITLAHDMLVATSAAGFFTCNRIDCAGLGQAAEPIEDNGIVEVVEFYNVDLKHYFITSSEAELKLIADGLAGAGWVRTGESFLAWELGSNVEAENVCRFYGSMYPGPNSHFYSLSMQDCRSLMNLQETQPSTQPRWNFERYAFSVMPPIKDIDEPCAEDFIPVYRAYNNGFARGEDSAHRYVTDPELLKPLLDEGWSEEGVVFCSPTE